jgi:DNA modification methylase
MEIKKLKDLTPDSKNANKGSERGQSMIENSLRQYGAGRSILIDKNGVIIAGNKTAENAGSIGLEDVIVVQTDGTKLVAVQRMDLDLTTDEAAKALSVVDNRASEVSLSWDIDVLKDLGTEIDLEQFWSKDELAALLAVEILPAELVGDEDAVPEVPEEPVTKPGDLYILGNHRLLCGDSTNILDVDRLIDNDLCDMVWTDPPYNVAYEGKTKDKLKIENDEKTDEDFRQFLQDAYTSMFAACKEGASIYVAHADLEGYNFRGAMLESGWMIKQCLIWLKNSLVMGRQDYQSKHEPILYGWKPGAAHTWMSDRKQTTVLEFDRPSRSTEHPTMKPVALVEYCIGNSSVRGAKVLDLFGGSGTTMLACEKLGRRARLMELDPRYCDVIVRRWEEATGKKAERAADGVAAR